MERYGDRQHVVMGAEDRVVQVNELHRMRLGYFFGGAAVGGIISSISLLVALAYQANRYQHFMAEFSAECAEITQISTDSANKCVDDLTKCVTSCREGEWTSPLEWDGVSQTSWDAANPSKD